MKCPLAFMSIAALFMIVALSGCDREDAPDSRSVLQKLANISPERAEALALQQTGGTVKQEQLELENGVLVYSFDIQTPDNRIMEVQINAKDGSLVMQKEETPQAEKMEKQKESEGMESSKKEENKVEASEENSEEKAVTRQKIGEESASETPTVELQKAETREKSAESHIVGSIPVQKDTELTSLAKISEQQARAAALNLAEGTVEKIELENEDGYLVYVVEVKFRGDEYEVLVDAGNGKVLSIEAD